MHVLPILLAIALSGNTAADARLAALPEACQAEVHRETGTYGALDSLLYSNVEPLCAKYPRPRSGDYLVRRTSTEYPAVRRFTDVQAHAGRLKIVVNDTLFLPPDGRRLTTTMSAGAFLRALDRAGFMRLWSAADECPPDGLVYIAEAGTIWEFYDNSGYQVRDGPRWQGCHTDYAGVHQEVAELFDDLEEKSRLVWRFTPEVPKDE